MFGGRKTRSNKGKKRASYRSRKTANNLVVRVNNGERKVVHLGRHPNGRKVRSNKGKKRGSYKPRSNKQSGGILGFGKSKPKQKCLLVYASSSRIGPTQINGRYDEREYYNEFYKKKKNYYVDGGPFGGGYIGIVPLNQENIRFIIALETANVHINKKIKSLDFSSKDRVQMMKDQYDKYSQRLANIPKILERPENQISNPVENPKMKNGGLAGENTYVIDRTNFYALQDVLSKDKRDRDITKLVDTIHYKKLYNESQWMSMYEATGDSRLSGYWPRNLSQLIFIEVVEGSCDTSKNSKIAVSGRLEDIFRQVWSGDNGWKNTEQNWSGSASLEELEAFNAQENLAQ